MDAIKIDTSKASKSSLEPTTLRPQLIVLSKDVHPSAIGLSDGRGLAPTMATGRPAGRKLSPVGGGLSKWQKWAPITQDWLHSIPLGSAGQGQGHGAE